MELHRAPRNRTLTLSKEEERLYRRKLGRLTECVPARALTDLTLSQTLESALPYLPERFVDLLFLDPPYNLSRNFGTNSFEAMSLDQYEAWFAGWFEPLLRTLKPTASVYVCGDWRSSAAIHRILARHLKIRTRITWEREKGRGAKANWKNASEDIWFATVSDKFIFNIEDVKIKRRVLAPYRELDGRPKDWRSGKDGNYRLTHPSNLWTDLTVPFWSMPENTDHPTQKPEKLLAKILLASTEPGQMVFDPFLGSGTTSVVAKKLKRHYLGIETNPEYGLWTEKRIALADQDPSIQGYENGVFWERNSHPKE